MSPPEDQVWGMSITGPSSLQPYPSSCCLCREQGILMLFTAGSGSLEGKENSPLGAQPTRSRRVTGVQPLEVTSSHHITGHPGPATSSCLHPPSQGHLDVLNKEHRKLSANGSLLLAKTTKTLDPGENGKSRRLQ